MQIPPWQSGAFVRKLRLERGLTQRQLAHLAGESFDEREIRRLERGMFGGMRPDRLQRVLDVLQSDFRALYRWSLLSEEMIPLVRDWQVDRSAPGRLDGATEIIRGLEEARQRLHAAILASRATYQQTTELLAASRRWVDWWTGSPAPQRGEDVMSSQP
jgi:transcriptional regulator with XRE-family HTH domain